MAPTTLVAVGVADSVTAGVFVTVAWRLGQRQTAVTDRIGLQALQLWWLALGVFMAIQAFQTWAALADALSVPVFMAMWYLTGPVLGAASWGLSFHLLYIYTGKTRLALPLAAYFAVMAVLYDVIVHSHPAAAIELGAWEVAPVIDPPLSSDVVWSIVLAGIGLPLLVACGAYMRLVPRLDLPGQKRRAILVSTSIALWVLAGLIGQFIGGPFARFATVTGLGLLAALAVAVAYFGRDEEPRVDS